VIAYVRTAVAAISAVLAVLAGGTAAAQQLTARDLASARAFLGMDDTHPHVLEVSGWRTEADEVRGWPVYVYAYGSLLEPEPLLDRLCVVESRWIQGVVIDDDAVWVPEIFQIRYEIWESARPTCAADGRSQLPERISLPTMIDGAVLLRILDGSDELLQAALQRLPEGERPEHKSARLVEIAVSGFTYSAQFRSNRSGGISVRFSEATNGFAVHSAGEIDY
jgi:hypothetical protein